MSNSVIEIMCELCGTKNTLDDQFCRHCGESMRPQVFSPVESSGEEQKREKEESAGSQEQHNIMQERLEKERREKERRLQLEKEKEEERKAREAELLRTIRIPKIPEELLGEQLDDDSLINNPMQQRLNEEKREKLKRKLLEEAQRAEMQKQLEEEMARVREQLSLQEEVPKEELLKAEELLREQGIISDHSEEREKHKAVLEKLKKEREERSIHPGGGAKEEDQSSIDSLIQKFIKPSESDAIAEPSVSTKADAATKGGSDAPEKQSADTDLLKPVMGSRSISTTGETQQSSFVMSEKAEQAMDEVRAEVSVEPVVSNEVPLPLEKEDSKEEISALERTAGLATQQRIRREQMVDRMMMNSVSEQVKPVKNKILELPNLRVVDKTEPKRTEEIEVKAKQEEEISSAEPKKGVDPEKVELGPIDNTLKEAVRSTAPIVEKVLRNDEAKKEVEDKKTPENKIFTEEKKETDPREVSAQKHPSHASVASGGTERGSVLESVPHDRDGMTGERKRSDVPGENKVSVSEREPSMEPQKEQNGDNMQSSEKVSERSEEPIFQEIGHPERTVQESPKGMNEERKKVHWLDGSPFVPIPKSDMTEEEVTSERRSAKQRDHAKLSLDLSDRPNEDLGYQTQRSEKIFGLEKDRVEKFLGRNADYYLFKFNRLESRRNILSWNGAAFLFGEIWLIYRKRYVSFLITYITFILLRVLSKELVLWMIPIWRVGLAFICNHSYFRYMKKQVADEQELDDPYLEDIHCKAKGGTNLTLALIYVLFWAMIFGFVLYVGLFIMPDAMPKNLKDLETFL